MTSMEDVTLEDIAQFQAVMLEVAQDVRERRERTGNDDNRFWPYLLPGIEAHLPVGITFDHWTNGESQDGLRPAQLRYEEEK